LTSIWEDKYVESVGINSWRCLCCNKLFKPKHARRAITHMVKENNLGIAICSAVVSKEHSPQYINLFHHTVNKAMNHKHGQETVLNAAKVHQDATAFTLCQKKLKTTLVQSSLFSTPSAAGSVSTTSSMAPKPHSPQRWLQSSLNSLIDQWCSQMLGPFQMQSSKWPLQISGTRITCLTEQLNLLGLS